VWLDSTYLGILDRTNATTGAISLTSTSTSPLLQILVENQVQIGSAARLQLAYTTAV
jgi:hypothetical protein